ncbi:hypothetical protein [Streptomyces lydicus]|uniref:hypothetical protein n=1 Tax=Streptomyces lydicus TaxID=47763 RepID=UPI001012761C|nr:hypothetical protein [Streptomyces lydicus]MCZ1012140.1 hypothetical protein [Streptomyces lydicus]
MSAPHTPTAGPASEADDLRARLEQLRILVLDPTFEYPTFADLVLAHGCDYAPAPWPAGAHPRLLGDCFTAAHRWADREGWTYCEGYALAADPLTGAFEHAWCLTPDGHVADPAAPDGWTLAYRGIPLTDVFRRAHVRDGDAVITFGHDLLGGPNIAVLRDGLPDAALAASDSHAAATTPGRRPSTAPREG